jgi:hypothetical protein
MKYNKEIVLITDIHLPESGFGPEINLKAGTVIMADRIDERGFAFVNKLETGFFDNEYEFYIPSLENK